MRITSYGAAKGVTGSKHLLEVNGHRILYDCGLFQGHRRKAAERNRNFPAELDKIDAVVLSHAHIDHSGTLPVLAKNGYTGPVFATPATRDLCAVMLMDSARIQEHDAKYLSKKEHDVVPPIYEEKDAREIMRRFVSVPYDMPLEVVPDVRVTFKDAGHVLGSAMTLTEFKENGSTRRFLYSGDIGRKNMPILSDPWEPDDADLVVMEGTYGDRDHDPIETLDSNLANVINSTYDRGGKIVVPSFALERAQELVYALKRLEAKDAIPTMPVFVDSPLTVNITEVFRLHTDLFDETTQDFMEDEGSPFQLNNIEYIRRVERSKSLNEVNEPAIIISASGMCEFGRIVHHLKNNCTDERNSILIVGFQAVNTLGRRIVERQRSLKIFGNQYPLRAHVKVLNSLSAHAGRSELIDFGARFNNRAGKVLLVHGEDKSLDSLSSGLEERGCTNVEIQKYGEPCEV